MFAGGCTLEAAETVCGGDGTDLDTDIVFELLAGLVARSLVVAEEHGPESRYRLLETIRQFSEERLGEAGEIERWRARHADYYASLLPRIRHQSHDPGAEVLWARLSADQDNLLAAWSLAIDIGNVDTAFSMLAGFAPSEVRTSYLLLLPGEASLALPGATEHRGYALALAVSAVFASARSDRVGAEELCRRAAEANARRDPPDWRVEETVCAARSNIAITTGAFADAARLSEQAAGIARAGGDFADASLQLAIAAGLQLFIDDTPGAVSLAREALALARQVGAPARIATGLLAVGMAVAQTDPDQARACLRESRELSIALGYESVLDHVWAIGLALLIGDRTATLQLGRRAIHALGWSGERIRMGIILHLIAGALAATRPDAAATIQGAAEAYVVQAPRFALASSTSVTGALGDARARELRGRGANMDWDQAIAYTLTQTTQALTELQSESQPQASGSSTSPTGWS